MSQNRNKIVRDLTEGNVTWTMLTFAAPLFLSSLLQTVYNVTDMKPMTSLQQLQKNVPNKENPVEFYLAIKT